MRHIQLIIRQVFMTSIAIPHIALHMQSPGPAERQGRGKITVPPIVTERAAPPQGRE